MTRKKKLIVVALVLTVVPACTGVWIICVGLCDHIEPADVAIVLGSAVNENGEPSPRLRARLDKAAELYQQKLFAKVLVSGGIDSRGNDEGKCMARYLREHGVGADDILTDSGGNTTWLTAQNAARIMHDNHLHSAMAITQYFHIARTELALRRCGINCSGHAYANLFELRDVYSIVREIVGIYAYLMK